MSMTCAEFREQVEGFALEALEPAEQAACQAHLDQGGPHEGCLEALERARATVAELALSLPPVRVPPHLWGKVEAQLPLVARTSPTRHAPRWREPLAWAVAAGFALAFLGVRALDTRHVRELEAKRDDARTALASATTCQAQLDALRSSVALPREALAMLEVPGTAVVALAPQPGHGQRASVLFNRHARRAMLISSALKPVSGRQYVLWVIEGHAAPRAAGILEGTAGMAVAEFDPKLLTHPDALAVSLEPVGAAAVPTDILLVGAVQGS